MIDSLILGAILVSYHPTSHSTQIRDGLTPGIYVSHTSSCLSASAFRNSYGKPSLFLGCTIPPFGTGSQFAVSIGRLTGYPTHRFAIIPSWSPAKDARIFLGLGQAPSITLAYEWK